jgi:hypothetical protein
MTGDLDAKEWTRSALMMEHRFFDVSNSRKSYQRTLRMETYDWKTYDVRADGSHLVKRVTNEKGLEFVVGLARDGCQDAEIVLRELIADFINAGDPIPGALRDSATRLVSGKAISDKPGRERPKPAKYWERDGWLLYMVATLVKKYGLKPTRNAATGDLRPELHSACSLIAEVAAGLKIAGLSEKNVSRIWDRDGREYIEYSEANDSPPGPAKGVLPS